MLKDSQGQRAAQHHAATGHLESTCCPAATVHYGADAPPRSRCPLSGADVPPRSCCLLWEPLSTLEPINHLGGIDPRLSTAGGHPGANLLLPYPVSVSGVISVLLPRPPTPLQAAKAMLSHGHLQVVNYLFTLIHLFKLFIQSLIFISMDSWKLISYLDYNSILVPSCSICSVDTGSFFSWLLYSFGILPSFLFLSNFSGHYKMPHAHLYAPCSRSTISHFSSKEPWFLHLRLKL